MAVVSKDRRPVEPQTRTLLAIFVSALTVIIILSVVVWNGDRQKIELAFGMEATAIQSQLASRLREHRALVAGTRAAYQFTPAYENSPLNQIERDPLAHYPELRWLGFVRVDNQAVSERISPAGSGQSNPQPPAPTEESDELTAESEFHLVHRISAAQFTSNQEEALLNKSAVLRTLRRALATGTAVVGGRIQLPGDSSRSYSYLLAEPVYPGGETPVTLNGRLAKVSGIVVGLFGIEKMLALLDQPPGIGLELFDTGGTTGTTNLFSGVLSGAGSAELPLRIVPESFDREFALQHSDRPWRLRILGLPEYVASISSSRVPWILAPGIVVGVLGGLLLVRQFRILTAWQALAGRRSDQLRESEERHRAIVDKLVDAVITIDEDGIIWSYNRAAAQVFGFTAEEALGKDVGVLMSTQMAAAHRAALERYRQTGVKTFIGRRREVMATHKDGHEFPIELAVSEVPIDGKRHLNAVVRDLTASKELANKIARQQWSAEVVHKITEIANLSPSPDVALQESMSILGRAYSFGAAIGLQDLQLPSPSSTALAWTDSTDAGRELLGWLQGNPPHYREIVERVLDEKTAARALARPGRIPSSGNPTASRNEVQLFALPVESGGKVYALFVFASSPPSEAEELKTIAASVGDRLSRVFERYQAAVELAAAETRTRSILDSAGEGICGLDSSGCVLFANPAAADLLGGASPDLVGRNVVNAIWPPENCERDGGPALHPLLQTLRDGQTRHGSDVQFARLNGGRFPAEYAVTATRDKGQISGAVLIFRDISARLRVQAALRESEERWSFALNSADEGVWDWNLRTDEVVYSEGWARILGYGTDEIDNKPSELFRRIHPDDRSMVEATLANHLRGRSPNIRVEFRMRCRDGSYKWILKRGKIVARDGSGAPLRIIGTHTDISLHKQAEAAIVAARVEAEEASNAKTAFMSTISHELRTPLNGIMGMAQVLQNTPLDGQQLDYVKTILECGLSLLRLIEDLLDFAQLNAGRLELAEYDLDLEQLIKDACALVEPAVSAKGLRIIFACEPATKSWIVGDEKRIRQVLVHLLNNAIKFTDHGYVTVRFAIVQGVSGSETRIDVEDTGIGIEPAAQAKLFTPFSQGDGSITRRFGGTGLGLAMCSNFARLMSGHIDLTSQVGRGSKFTFRWPAKLPRAELNSPFNITPTRVIVISAHEPWRVELQRQLEFLGHMVIVAASFDHGLALMSSLSEESCEVWLVDQSIALRGQPIVPVPQAVRTRANVTLWALVPIPGNIDPQAWRAAGYHGVKPAIWTRAELARLIAGDPDCGFEGSYTGSVQLRNNETLEKLNTLMGAQLSGLVESYIANMEAKLAELQTAALAQDSGSLEHTAHGAKGISGNIGASAMLEIMGRLETASCNGETAVVPELLREARTVFAHTCGALRSSVATLAPDSMDKKGQWPRRSTVLDGRRLDNLRLSVGDANFARLLQLFVERAHGTLDELPAAVAAMNRDKLGQLLANLATTSGNVGATVLSAAAGELEEKSRRGDLTEVLASLQSLREELARVELELGERSQVTAAEAV